MYEGVTGVWGCGGSFGSYLKKTSKNVKLEHGDVVVASEVDCGFESHGLQPGADGVHVVKALPEYLPGYYCPETTQTHTMIRLIETLLHVHASHTILFMSWDKCIRVLKIAFIIFMLVISKVMLVLA